MNSRRQSLKSRAGRAVVPVSLAVIALVLLTAAIGAVVHPESRRYLTLLRGAPAEAAYSSPITHPESGPPIARFAIAGDVGTGDDEEYETAAAMTRLLREGPVDGLVLLGDNVYPNGNPDQLRETVFVPFGSLLHSGTELLPVLGNHDIRDGNGPGQIEALGMPGPWYAKEFDDVLFIGLDSNIAADPWQLHWLIETLDSSDATWKIVGMHHPPYSAGMHGSHDPSLEHFVPQFEQFDVDLVLAGHDHDYQRSKEINGVTYVVSGGAAKLRPTSFEDFTAASWSVHHFVELVVFEDRIIGQAVAQDGRAFDRFEIQKTR